MAERPCGNSHDLRVQRTNRYLREAFIRLLGKKSIEQISIQELCEAATVRRTTFYQHFRDKQDFLSWFIRDQQHKFIAAPREISSIDQLEAYYTQVILNLLKYLKTNAKVVHLLLEAGVEGRLVVDAFSQACTQDVENQLQHVPDIEKSLGGVPLSLAAEFYTGGLMAAARWWLSLENPCSEEEMASYIHFIIGRKNIPPLPEA